MGRFPASSSNPKTLNEGKIMTVHKGFVRTTFLDRGYCFLRERATGRDIFAHRDDFNCAPTEIVKGLEVTCELAEYEIKGEKRVKAINITPAVKL